MATVFGANKNVTFPLDWNFGVVSKNNVADNRLVKICEKLLVATHVVTRACIKVPNTFVFFSFAHQQEVEIFFLLHVYEICLLIVVGVGVPRLQSVVTKFMKIVTLNM